MSNKQKTAIITGITGQDGSYLAELLLSKNYKVVGIKRRSSMINEEDRLNNIFGNKNLELVYGNLSDTGSIWKTLKNYKPDEIYNLGAQSHVRVSFDVPEETVDVVGMGTLRLLNAMKELCPEAKLYQASSSVSGDTKVLIKLNNKTSLVEIKDLVSNNDMRTHYSNLECLSIDSNMKTKWSKVAYVFKHKSNNIFNLKCSGGVNMTITGNHSVIVLGQDGSLKEKQVSDLKKNDFLLSFSTIQNQNTTIYPTFNVENYKPNYNAKNFIPNNEISLNKDLMRLFGYYVAEGNLFIEKVKNHNITFTFHIKEKNYTEDIKKIIFDNFKIDSYHEQEILEKNTRKLTFSIKQLSNFLKNEFNTGSHKKKIPSWMYNIPQEGFIEFLRGYIGDAKVKNNEVSYTSVNKNLIENICYISKLNGLYGTIVERFNKEHLSPQKTLIKDSTCYDLKFYGKDADIILNRNINRSKRKQLYSTLVPIDICHKYKTILKLKQGKKAVSKQRILKVLKDNNIFDPVLEKICHSDLHVLKIKNITKLETEIDVYDLHVPETQMFIGGNHPVLLHNSEMYGTSTPPNGGYTEETKMMPASPYACAKLFSHNLIKNYRESYGMFLCSGILFNHESIRRGENFVTRKISIAAAKIKTGVQDKLYLGNLDAKRDWGHAPDFVEGMYLMLQQEKPDDYVLATGETHTVKEYLEETFKLAGLNINEHVEIDSRLFRPEEVPLLLGDASKAKEKLKWEPKTKFKDLVQLMYQYEIDNLVK